MNIRITRLFTVIVLAFSPNTYAASFDCKKSKSFVEKKICTTPDLSKLDDELAIEYKGKLSNLNPSDADTLKQSQRKWIEKREECSKAKDEKSKGTDSFKDCLIKSFEDRKIALSPNSIESINASTSAPLTETYSNGELKFKFSYPSSMKPVLGTSVEGTLSNEGWSEFYKISNPKSKDGTLTLILDTGSRAALRVGYRDGNAEADACSDHSKESSLAANGNGFEKKTISGQDFWATAFGDAGMQKYMNAVHYETFHNNRCLIFEKIIRGVNCTVYEEGKKRQDCEISESKSKAAYEELNMVLKSIEIFK